MSWLLSNNLYFFRRDPPFKGRGVPKKAHILRTNCSMCCMMQTYFRGGLVSITNEVGALEGTTKYPNDAGACSAFCERTFGGIGKAKAASEVLQNARYAKPRCPRRYWKSLIYANKITKSRRIFLILSHFRDESGREARVSSAYFSMVKIFKTIKVNIGCQLSSIQG